MLNLLFLLLLTTVITVSPASAGESVPRICEQYRQDHSESRHNTKARRDIAFGDGLLWEIRSAGGSINYLFGTMHSQDRKVTSIPPPVRLALQKSRILLMEVVPDETAQQQFLESIYFADDSNLQTMVDSEIYEDLVFKIADYGVPAEDVWRLKPWAAFTLIGRPRPVRATTQEQVLMTLAMNSGKSIAGIETMAELGSVLDSIPLDDQIIILNDTVCNHSGIIRKTRDLVDMYMARDLAGIVIFNEQPHYDEGVFDRFMQHILHDRNERILERIDPYLKQGGSFIAIGASHLPDEKGLLQSLENRGYKISKIY